MARGRPRRPSPEPSAPKRPPSAPAGEGLLLLALFLSGAAALGYQVLWTRLLALALGSETLGMLGVLTGFFGGLALGSWLLHSRARRSPAPALLFARLELAAALYALASPWLLHELARRLPPLLGPAAGANDTAMALGLSVATAGLSLLPGTLPMGATLAAVVEARRRTQPAEAQGRAVGALYAANTLGAMAGVLGAVFVLLPRLGLGWGAAALSALGLAAAAVAWAWSRGRAVPAAAEEAPAGRAPRAILLLVTATGFAGIGLEVVAVQIMAQVLADTVYTFALALAAYLLGTALGSAAYAAAAPRLQRAEHPRLTAILLLSQSATVVVAAVALREAPALLAWAAPPGAGPSAHLLGELLLALAVFLLPTALMGALFTHLLAAVAPQGVGHAYALNTLAGAAAPFAFGLAALRTLGYAATLGLTGALYLLLALAVTARLGRPARLRLGAAAVAAAGLFVLRHPLTLVPVPPGWEARFEKASLMGLVLVTEERQSSLPGGRPYRRLQVNGRFRMGGSSAFIERRMGHLPLLLAPGARSALFLGVGTGGTVSAVRHFPVERTDAVELVPEVLEALSLFDEANERVRTDGRVRFHAADARRFVAASAQRWDLVVGDLFHPDRDGAGSLYAREHFQAVAAHLSPGGVYAQWLPLFQLDVEPLRTVVRTFLDVFPEAHSVLGNLNAQTPTLVLLGRIGPAPGVDRWPIPGAELQRLLQRPIYTELELQDARELLAYYMLDREALRRFAGEAPPNTDMQPRVMFQAPHITYQRPADQAWRCLAALLAHRVPVPPDLVRLPPPAPGEAAAFARAVDLYLTADIARLRDRRFSREAVDGYLAARRAAPEFGPAGGALDLLSRKDPRVTEYIRARLASP